LVGVREAGGDEAADTMGRALDSLYGLPGVEPGPEPDADGNEARAVAG
jgi:hypothetical protein